MNLLVKIGLSSAIVSLIIHIGTFSSHIEFWRDTLEHQSISLCISFAVIVFLIYSAISGYISTEFISSRVVLPLATLILLTVTAVGKLNVGVLIKLPSVVTEYATIWYAFPASIAVYFVALFIVRRY